MKPNKAWRHNGAVGQVVWAIKALEGMFALTTLTNTARSQLSITLLELEELHKELQKKKDD